MRLNLWRNHLALFALLVPGTVIQHHVLCTMAVMVSQSSCLMVLSLSLLAEWIHMPTSPTWCLAGRLACYPLTPPKQELFLTAEMIFSPRHGSIKTPDQQKQKKERMKTVFVFPFCFFFPFGFCFIFSLNGLHIFFFFVTFATRTLTQKVVEESSLRRKTPGLAYTTAAFKGVTNGP